MNKLSSQTSQALFLNQISLSFLTTPFVAGLMVFDSLCQGFQDLGELSQEMFRGDRLPVLHLTEIEDIED
jgi:hypothetical protein